MGRTSKIALLALSLISLASCGTTSTPTNISKAGKVRFVDDGTWRLGEDEILYIYLQTELVQLSGWFSTYPWTYDVTIAPTYLYAESVNNETDKKGSTFYLFARENVSWMLRGKNG